MKILKLILLAFPAFLVSLLFITNPAHAASVKSAPATEISMVASAPSMPEFIAPKLNPASNPIVDEIGCSCASCVKSQFHLLQGKLPL